MKPAAIPPTPLVITRSPVCEWEVHKNGCKDLRNRERFPTAAKTVKELVYEEFEGREDEDVDFNWRTYVGEFVIKPCTGGLPVE